MSDLSPSVLTIIAGLQQGTALQVHPTIGTAAATLISKASALRASPANTFATLTFANVCSEAAYRLTSMSGNIWQGNPTKFGIILQQVVGHLSTSGAISSSSGFLGNTSFDEYGSGITSVGSLTTQGLDVVFGNLSSAANVMEIVGPIYDLTDIKTFGTSVGVVNKLNQVKLGRVTGINAALIANNVDLTNLADPVYTDTVDRTLLSITDPAIIKEVTTQLSITPAMPLTSLLDLTDIVKLVPASKRTGLVAGLKTMGQKFADMGASFKLPADAAKMLRSITIPDATKLNGQSSIASLVTSLGSAISSATGTGSNPNGLPNVTDFTQPVSGGVNVNAVISTIQSTVGDNYTAQESTVVTGLTSMVEKSQSLFDLAGIDLINSPTISLTTIVSLAGGIGQFGIDTMQSNVANVVIAMTTNDLYGDAVKSTIAEAVNTQQMIAAGIKPITFKG